MRIYRALTALTFVGLLVGCGEPSPVGKWQEPDGTTVEFIKDGTVVFGDTNGHSFSGKWSTATDGKILVQVNVQGTTIAMKAHFDGDNLVTDDAQSMVMRRTSS